MAHYRNINIDGKELQYNIGKKFVEIRSDDGKELVEKKDIEFVKDGPITQKMIVDYLHGELGNPSKYFPTCRCLGVDKFLKPDPYHYEINDKVVWKYLCKNCILTFKKKFKKFGKVPIMTIDDLKSGDGCTVNSCSDISMMHEVKKFIYAECTFIKITKSGLYQVSLKDDPKQTVSVPKSNVDVLYEKCDNCRRLVTPYTDYKCRLGQIFCNIKCADEKFPNFNSK